MSYYNRVAIPTFSNYDDEAEIEFPDQIKQPDLPVPLDLSKSIFSESQKNKLRNLIKQHRKAFAVNDAELGRTHKYVHRLRLKPGAQPPRTRLYQTNARDREIIKKHITDMLQNRIIKPVSEGIYSSPTLLVPKKDGGLRFCADLREMNKILEEDVYPLPLIRDVLDAIGTSKSTIYSIVDLRSAFWQIEVHPASQKYLTINTHMGRYAFRVLPFGLHSSPSAFQRLMNTVLRGILWDYAIPFLDDIVVYSKNAETHLFHLQEIFKRLEDAGLKLKPQKCEFGLDEIQYLGHRIGRKGISPFSDKVKAIREFKTPTTVTEIKSFLGLANYYRKFIKDFSRKAKPLNELTKKGTPFLWTEKAQESFMELKRRLVTSPVLAHADPALPFRLTTDASRTGLGWVLEQKQDGKFRVICYGGKSLTPAQSNYGISDLEALAVVTAIKDLDCYLRYQKFTILTDHQPLKYMLTNANPPPGRWSRWIALLSPYQFEVEYLKGSANNVADTLSRQKHSTVASDQDDLETYLCPVHSDKSEALGYVSRGCYFRNDPSQPLTKAQKNILSPPVKSTPTAAVKTPKNTFHRTKTWVKYKSQDTIIRVGRTDPAQVPADCILNFTTSEMKPIGPVSKSIQMAGGPEYKKLLQKSLNKNGHLRAESVRKLEGGCTNTLWIYNMTLPKYKVGKVLASNQVYSAIQNALKVAAEAQIKKLIISPTDLVSLEFPAAKAVEITVQAVWDYCQKSENTPLDEILMPIQTLSMAERTGKTLRKLQDNPTNIFFKVQKMEKPEIIRQRLKRPDKTITDPQRLIKDLTLSEGFSNLDYDIDASEIKKMQLKDDYFGLIINYLKEDELPQSEKLAKKIRKDSQNFELISGILYNFWIIPKEIPFERRARFRLCVPAELRHRLMYAYHDTIISAHRSAEKMYLLMKLNYYWKGMYGDLHNWTQSCVRCSKAKAMPKTRRAKLQPIVEHRPMGMVNIDLIGPMQWCPEQYRYVLTMVDRATRYCFAVPIPDGSAITIAKTLFSEVISKFGLIDYIVSDRGLNFTSPIVQHLCSLLGTKRILTSAYRPSSNGLVESFNGVFKRKLLTLVGEHPETWPKYVDGVLYALRTTVVDSLGYSPYELIFAREPKLLLEIGPDVLKTHPSKSVRRYMADLRTQLNYVSEAARKTELKQKQRMKEEYDKRCKPYQYQEGDKVWIRSPQTTAGSTRKFRDKYVGPYVLGKQTSENTFKVRREDSQVMSDIALHSDRFKPCISRYVKPAYIPGITDEQLVGPDLPLDQCREEDYEEEEEAETAKESTSQPPSTGVQILETAAKRALNEPLASDKQAPNEPLTSGKRPLSDLADPSGQLLDKLQEIVDQLGEQVEQGTQSESVEPPAEDVSPEEPEFYPIDRIIRGKYTPSGIKYLIKWKGYSPKHNSWEGEEDLSPETKEILKEKPVRIFGKKPTIPTSTQLPVDEIGENKDQDIDLDPDLAHEEEDPDPLKGMTEKEIQEAYEADTDVDSDATEDYEF